jgi:hypothetical protein
MPHAPGQCSDHNFGALAGHVASGVAQDVTDCGEASNDAEWRQHKWCSTPCHLEAPTTTMDVRCRCDFSKSSANRSRRSFLDPDRPVWWCAHGFLSTAQYHDGNDRDKFLILIGFAHSLGVLFAFWKLWC